MCSTSGRVIREGHSIKKILKEVKRQSILIFGGQKYFRPRGQEVQNPGGGICLMSLKNSKEARRAESKEAVGIRIDPDFQCHGHTMSVKQKLKHGWK